jgi:hypothetical protein
MDRQGGGISKTITACFGKVPLFKNFFNAFHTQHWFNLIYKKASGLGIKMVPIDSPALERERNILRRKFTHDFGRLFTILANDLVLKRPRTTEMQEFLDQNPEYQTFIGALTAKDLTIHKQKLDKYLAVYKQLEILVEQKDQERENIMATNLSKLLAETDGNVMAPLGAYHTIKTQPETGESSALEKVSKTGTPVASIYCIARDHEFEQKTWGQLPESNKAQYIRTDCHSSISNLREAESATLKQAYDALIVIPKLKAA